mgnify:CR=1 FL=1
MCNPVLVGMAIGGGMAAIQGGGIEEILIGTVIGGVSAGVMAPAGQAFTAFSSGTAGASGGIFSTVGSNVFADGVVSAATAAGQGSMLGSMLMPPSNTGYTPAAQLMQHQALNMNTNVATTGSGGRQAAKSLATAISRTKKRKLTQDDVGDLSLDTSSFTNTGLQLA